MQHRGGVTQRSWRNIISIGETRGSGSGSGSIQRADISALAALAWRIDGSGINVAATSAPVAYRAAINGGGVQHAAARGSAAWRCGGSA